MEKYFLVNERAEPWSESALHVKAISNRSLTWDLTGNCTSYFSLGILQEFDKGWDKVATDHLVINSLGDLEKVSVHVRIFVLKASPYLFELVRNHVSNPPALVLEQTPQSSQQYTMTRLLLLRNDLGDSDQDLDSQKTYTILVIIGEVLEQRNHLVYDGRCWHGPDKFGQISCRLSAHHWGVIVNEL